MCDGHLNAQQQRRLMDDADRWAEECEKEARLADLLAEALRFITLLTPRLEAAIAAWRKARSDDGANEPPTT